MKYCTHCGERLEDNAIFCSNCGAQTNVCKEEDVSAVNNKTPYVAQEINNFPVAEVVPEQKPKQAKCWSVFAKIGYVLGIIGFIFSFIPFINICTIMIPIMGIIFSALGKHSFDFGKKAKKGFGLSLAGTIIAFVWGCISIGIIAGIIAASQNSGLISSDIWKEIFEETHIYMWF